MRTIKASEITAAVKNMAVDACHYINPEMIFALENAYKNETSDLGKIALEELLKNAEISRAEMIPTCQDTGLAEIFVEIGQDVKVKGGLLYDAVNQGVREGYEEGYLRKSMCDPVTRKNTGDNTPAVIHFQMTDGDKVKIFFMAKGGGGDNMSRVNMLEPHKGVRDIKDFVIQTCLEAGANACPPIVVGVGIGGAFDTVALLARRSLLNPLSRENPDNALGKMEQGILEEINRRGLGPQGFGGKYFALGVNILKEPCHVATLPVAVNIDCHAHRHKSMIL